MRRALWNRSVVSYSTIMRALRSLRPHTIARPSTTSPNWIPDGSLGRSPSLGPTIGAWPVHPACATPGIEEVRIVPLASAPALVRNLRRDSEDVIAAPHVKNAE